MNLEDRPNPITALPEHRSLMPVLSRMAIGLSCVLFALVMIKRNIHTHIVIQPDIKAVETPLNILRDGPKQNDLIQTATLHFEGNHSNIHLDALSNENEKDFLNGQVSHTSQHNVVFTKKSVQQKIGRALTAKIQILKKPIKDYSVTRNKHKQNINASISTFAPLTLSTQTQGGDQNLDLNHLQIKQLTAKSNFGDIDINLPEKDSSYFSLSTYSGDIRIESSAPAKINNLHIMNKRGKIHANLESLHLENLNIKTTQGDIYFTPALLNTSSILSTHSGDIEINIPEGTFGNLNINNKYGKTNIKIAKEIHVRLNFPEKEPIVLPKGAQGEPPLEIYVDTQDELFEYKIKESNK